MSDLTTIPYSIDDEIAVTPSYGSHRYSDDPSLQTIGRRLLKRYPVQLLWTAAGGTDSRTKR